MCATCHAVYTINTHVFTGRLLLLYVYMAYSMQPTSRDYETLPHVTGHASLDVS
jgi:hypothetical protein